MKYSEAEEGWTAVGYFSNGRPAVWLGRWWVDASTGKPVTDVKVVKLGTIWTWRIT